MDVEGIREGTFVRVGVARTSCVERLWSGNGVTIADPFWQEVKIQIKFRRKKTRKVFNLTSFHWNNHQR